MKTAKCKSVVLSTTPWREKKPEKGVSVSHRHISASLLCPYVKVFVLFKTARRQEEKKQLDPWIVPPASGSLGSASGLLSSTKPANPARPSELDKVAYRGKKCLLTGWIVYFQPGSLLSPALCVLTSFSPLLQVAAWQLASTLASRDAN